MHLYQDKHVKTHTGKENNNVMIYYTVHNSPRIRSENTAQVEKTRTTVFLQRSCICS